VTASDHDLVLTSSATGAVLVDGVDVVQELTDLEEHFKLALAVAATTADQPERRDVLPQQQHRGTRDADGGAAIFVLKDDLVVNSPNKGEVVIDGVYVLQELARLKNSATTCSGTINRLKEEYAAVSASCSAAAEIADVPVTTHTHTTITSTTTATPTTITTTTLTSTTLTATTITTSTSLTTTTLTTTTITTTTNKEHSGDVICAKDGSGNAAWDACEKTLATVGILDGSLWFQGNNAKEAQLKRITKGLTKVTGNILFDNMAYAAGTDPGEIEFLDLKIVGGFIGVPNAEVNKVGSNIMMDDLVRARYLLCKPPR
jgi:hypothetical protein